MITVAQDIEPQLHAIRRRVLAESQVNRWPGDKWAGPVYSFGDRAVQCLVERRRARNGHVMPMVGWRMDGRRRSINCIIWQLKKDGWT